MPNSVVGWAVLKAEKKLINTAGRVRIIAAALMIKWSKSIDPMRVPVLTFDCVYICLLIECDNRKGWAQK
ncbi:hypothetical protein D3C80_1938660 [compost metagenome]